MVEINVDRQAVEITWDKDLVDGDTVSIRSENPDAVNDDDRVSTRNADNDGRAVLTYPADYHGSSEVTVTGSDGGEDTGTISV